MTVMSEISTDHHQHFFNNAGNFRMENIEQEHTDFEAWYRHHHGDRDVYVLDESGEYADKQVQGAFNVWQARAALQSQDREDVKRPVLDSIVDEIHRRADKEWADDGYDFEVTITADEYKALCEEEKAIDHARRIEDKT